MEEKKFTEAEVIDLMTLFAKGIIGCANPDEVKIKLGTFSNENLMEIYSLVRATRLTMAISNIIK